MELISEERQRKVHEWLYPELKETGWTARPNKFWGHLVTAEWSDKDRGRFRVLTNFYTLDGQPNYQFFFTEIVPRLTGDGIGISFRKMPCDNRETLDFTLTGEDEATGDFHESWACNADPIAATAEYVEALEGR